MDNLPHILKHAYLNDFHAADEGFVHGRVAVTSKARVTHWKNWLAYVQPLGVVSFLQGTPYNTRIQGPSGFVA
jgi:hypothetical protein